MAVATTTASSSETQDIAQTQGVSAHQLALEGRHAPAAAAETEHGLNSSLLLDQLAGCRGAQPSARRLRTTMTASMPAAFFASRLLFHGTR